MRLQNERVLEMTGGVGWIGCDQEENGICGCARALGLGPERSGELELWVTLVMRVLLRTELPLHLFYTCSMSTSSVPGMRMYQ